MAFSCSTDNFGSTGALVVALGFGFSVAVVGAAVVGVAVVGAAVVISTDGAAAGLSAGTDAMAVAFAAALLAGGESPPPTAAAMVTPPQQSTKTPPTAAPMMSGTGRFFGGCCDCIAG